MKNHFFLLITSLITVCTIPSCDFDDDGFFHDCIKGIGPEIERALDLPEFTGVRLNADAKVFITQGDAFEVVAKGEANIIDLLDLDVRNNTWEIEFDHCVKSYDLEIFITMPNIKLLSISGSGSIRGENFFDAEDIVLRVSGSGDLCLGLFSENIDAQITGSGQIELEGEAEKLYCKITGSGDIKSFNLITEKADINLTGSGDASVHVLEILDVNISGSGNVYYKGHPIIHAKITGSGRVKDAN